MRIFISGLGVMGASMALALKQKKSDISVYGYDLDQVVAEALSGQVIDHPVHSWPDQCAEAELIVLCTPLHVIEQHLRQLAPVIGPETVVTDVGSTKRRLHALVGTLDFRGAYVGGHPMTGAEKTGLHAANPLLYENAVYILTNTGDEIRPRLERVLYPVLERLKARVMLMDAEIHDRIMAAISHVPQLVAIGLVNMVGQLSADEMPYFDLAAGGFRDLTRIASSSYGIWKDIIASNEQNVHDVLEKLITILQSQKTRLENLSEDFRNANQYRNQLPKIGKGFLSPLTDVLVYVPDEVGVIAKISNTLSDKKIDIRDIELLKIREKEGGVFRLSFEDHHKAAQAVELLNSIRYHAFIKE